MDKFKIVKKEKDGITIKFDENTIIKGTWEEFNNSFTIVDDYFAVPNKNAEAIQEQIDTLLNQLVVINRRNLVIEQWKELGINGSEYLSNLAALSNIFSKIQEISGFSVSQITNLARIKINQFNNFCGTVDHVKSIKEKEAAELKAKKEKAKECIETAKKIVLVKVPLPENISLENRCEYCSCHKTPKVFKCSEHPCLDDNGCFVYRTEGQHKLDEITKKFKKL